MGFELNGPLGKRAGHLAVRNAELNLIRSRTILAEQERQIQHDLNAAFTEVDRSFVSMKSSFNSRIAAQDELDPKRKRVEEGTDQVFFLLDAQQRQATAESAIHRAIADYNLAILNYHFATGGLLSRFNIQLTEGPWSENAQARASIKAGRLEPGKGCCSDTTPVSAGEFNPRVASAAYVPEQDGSSFQQAFPSEQSTQPTDEDLDSEPVDVDLDPLLEGERNLERDESMLSHPMVDPNSNGFFSGIADRLNSRRRR